MADEAKEQHRTLIELSVLITESGQLAHGYKTRLHGLNAEDQGHAIGAAYRAVHEILTHFEQQLPAGSHAEFWGGIEQARQADIQASQEVTLKRSDAWNERPTE